MVQVLHYYCNAEIFKELEQLSDYTCHHQLMSNITMDYSEGEVGVMGEALYGLFKDYQAGTSFGCSQQSSWHSRDWSEKMGVGMIDKFFPALKICMQLNRVQL